MIKSVNTKVLIILVILLVAGVVFYFKSSKPTNQETTPEQPKTNNTQSDQPQLVSTDPSPLENATILPTQQIKLTFSHPIENGGEFKYKIEPELEHKISLSEDRKTVIISPIDAYPAGSSFNLFIQPETKFDGGKKFNNDPIFHLNTIKYRGV